MNPTTILAISELAKLGLTAYLAYMQAAGLTDTQIEAVYQEAKKSMLLRDPKDIPDV